MDALTSGPPAYVCAVSAVRGSDRSYEPFTDKHLQRLARIALDDQAVMFTSSPHLAVYRDRLLLIALCQGGALHYIDRKNGVKDPLPKPRTEAAERTDLVVMAK